MDSSSRQGESCAGERRHEHAGSFAPAIDPRDIFRQLILDEIRSGRMTPRRRRQIVRYARDMGVPNRIIDRFMVECRNQLLRSPDPDERRHADEAAHIEGDWLPEVLRVANTVAALVAGYLLLLNWLL